MLRKGRIVRGCTPEQMRKSTDSKVYDPNSQQKERILRKPAIMGIVPVTVNFVCGDRYFYVERRLILIYNRGAGSKADISGGNIK